MANYFNSNEYIPGNPLNQQVGIYTKDDFNFGTATPGGWDYQLPTTNPNYGKPIMSGTTPTTPITPVPTVTPPTPQTGLSARQTFGQLTASPAPANQWQTSPGMSPSIGSPIYNMWDPKNYESGPRYEQLNRYLSAWYMPQQQLMQNTYQWGSEFDEGQRRWNTEFDMQNQMNQYNMGLQTRQQQMAEWEANEAARQWAEQFGWTQTTDQWSKELAQAQLAQQLQELRERLLAEQAMANVSAYGRALKPNARFVRNWG